MSKILRDTPVEKQISRSMRYWDTRRAEWQRDATDQQQARKQGGPYISISREAGSGGIEVARRLAERLGWQDSERQKFLQHHFRRSLEDLCAYDVVINTGHVNLEAATDSIVSLAEAKLGGPLASEEDRTRGADAIE